MYDNGLLEIQEAVKATRQASTKPIRVYTSYSVEGFILGALLTKALEREDIRFTLTAIHGITENFLETLEHEQHYTLYIFAGIGGKHYKDLNKVLKDKKIILLDTTTISIADITPLPSSVQTVSNAFVVYHYCKLLNPANKELAYLPLIIYNKHKTLPETLLEDAAESITKLETLTLFSSPTKPLQKILETSYEPYLHGISGSSETAQAFLHEYNIPITTKGKPTKLADLNSEQIKNFLTGVMIHRLGSDEELDNIYGTQLLLTNEDDESNFKSLADYYNLLETCAVRNKASIAIASLLSSKDARRELISIHTVHTRNVMDALTWYVTKRKQSMHIEHKTFTIINAEDALTPPYLSTLAHIISRWNLYAEHHRLLFLGHGMEETHVLYLAKGTLPDKLKEQLDVLLHPYNTTCTINGRICEATIPLEHEGELLKNAQDSLSRSGMEEAVVEKPL